MVNRLVITVVLLFVVGCDTSIRPSYDDYKPRAQGVIITRLAINSAHTTSSPDAPDNKSEICYMCDGTGIVGDSVVGVKCRTCNGTGKITPRMEDGGNSLPPMHDVELGNADMSNISGVTNFIAPNTSTPVVIEPIAPEANEISDVKLKELEENQKKIIQLMTDLKPSIDTITDAINKSSKNKEVK